MREILGPFVEALEHRYNRRDGGFHALEHRRGWLHRGLKEAARYDEDEVVPCGSPTPVLDAWVFYLTLPVVMTLSAVGLPIQTVVAARRRRRLRRYEKVFSRRSHPATERKAFQGLETTIRLLATSKHRDHLLSIIAEHRVELTEAEREGGRWRRRIVLVDGYVTIIAAASGHWPGRIVAWFLRWFFTRY